jgi:hypothetical protein
MRLLRFTFKNEAAWLVIFSLGVFLLGVALTFIVALAGWFVKTFGNWQ